MAKYERGIMNGVLRFNITLQTEDLTTHSFAGDNNARFELMADRIREHAQHELNELCIWFAENQPTDHQKGSDHVAKEVGG